MCGLWGVWGGVCEGGGLVGGLVGVGEGRGGEEGGGWRVGG